MAFIEPIHRNKPNITYLLTYQWTIYSFLFSVSTDNIFISQP